MTASRVELPPYEEMNANQKKIYDQTVAHFGKPMGPRLALLPADQVVTKWADLLKGIQESELPRNFWEMSILVVARYWNCQFEFWAHEAKARKEGVSDDVIDAIRNGQVPNFKNDDEQVVYQYCQELIYDKKVSDKTYQALRTFVGQKQLIELTVLMGHYSSVAMTLIAHEVALPDGVDAPLPS